MPLDLLLRLEALLGREIRRRRRGVNVVGELVARFGEVILDVAGRLVAVEPSAAVVVPLPAGGEGGHDQAGLLCCCCCFFFNPASDETQKPPLLPARIMKWKS
jgi:hypothetical protein